MADNTTNRERLREITDGIEQGIKDLFQSDRYAQYLRTMSRFHRYSVNNQMLIYMQKPDATLVAGFNKWRDQFERHVKKGERGIKIIAPTPFKKKQEREKIDPITQVPVRDRDGKIVTEEVEVQIPLFRPVAVFDVAQTEGKALPELAANLTGDVRQYEIFMEALRRASPVPISIETMSATMDGYFDTEHQDIAIRKGMSEVQTVSAAVHEIAHSKLHNYEKERLAAAAGDETKEPPRPKDRRTEEVEAESISFAVCAYYGIQTGENSFGYIASWSKDKELPELRASLEVINKTASGLITDIDRHFAELCKERGVDLTAPVEESASPEQEALYLLDDTAYLHVQASEDGYDYTLYDRKTWREIDGGQLDSPGLSLTAARDEILTLHELAPERVEPASLDILEEIQAEQELPPTMPRRYGLDENGEVTRLWNGKTPEEFTEQDVQAFMADTENALSHATPPATPTMLPETPEQALDEYPMPDPALTVADLEKCFYMDGDMLPLSSNRAVELHDNGFAAL